MDERISEMLTMARKHLRFAVVKRNGITNEERVVAKFTNKAKAEKWCNDRFNKGNGSTWYGPYSFEYRIESYFA